MGLHFRTYSPNGLYWASEVKTQIHDLVVNRPMKFSIKGLLFSSMEMSGSRNNNYFLCGRLVHHQLSYLRAMTAKMDVTQARTTSESVHIELLTPIVEPYLCSVDPIQVKKNFKPGDPKELELSSKKDQVPCLQLTPLKESVNHSFPKSIFLMEILMMLVRMLRLKIILAKNERLFQIFRLEQRPSIRSKENMRRNGWVEVPSIHLRSGGKKHNVLRGYILVSLLNVL